MILPSQIVTTTITTSHGGLAWEGMQDGTTFPFNITSHHITMNPQGDHIPTPRSDRNPFVHLRNSNKGKKSSIACGARAKRKSSVATFPDFTLLGVFCNPVHQSPSFPCLRVFFVNLFIWLLHRSERYLPRGSFGESGLCLYD